MPEGLARLQKCAGLEERRSPISVASSSLLPSLENDDATPACLSELLLDNPVYVELLAIKRGGTNATFYPFNILGPYDETVLRKRESISEPSPSLPLLTLRQAHVIPQASPHAGAR